MGSINPIPILHSPYQPQQQPDIAEQYGRILQLKNMMALAPLQQQEAQQRVHQGQMNLQQSQREMDSQNVIMKAYTDSGGDLAKAYDAAAKTGKALPGDLLKLQQAHYTMQEQAYKTLQEKGNRALQEADFMSGAADAVKNAPPEARPTVYQQQLANLQKAGVDISQVPPQYPGDQQFNALSLGLQSHKAALDQVFKQAETAKDTAQAREANAGAAIKEQEVGLGPIGPAAQAKYRFILQKAASGQQLAPDEVAFAKGFEASEAKNTTQSDSLGVTSSNTSRPAGLSTVMRGQTAPRAAGAPSGGGVAPLLPSSNLPSGNAMSPANVKNSIVDEIGQYKADPALLGRMMYKHPELLGMVNQKYPDWDQTTYQAKSSLIKGYTSGTQSKEINAINTAMGHLKVLDDAVEALKNGDVAMLNSIGNKLGVATGSTPQTTFQTIVHRVGPEISSAYIPGGGGEAERFANEKDFSEDKAPQQLHDNAAISVKLLRSKVGALENQYKNTVGRDDFNKRFITPEAQAAFDKFGGSAASGGASKPSGLPPEGTVKTNSHGDKIVVKGGQWVLAQ